MTLDFAQLLIAYCLVYEGTIGVSFKQSPGLHLKEIKNISALVVSSKHCFFINVNQNLPNVNQNLPNVNQNLPNVNQNLPNTIQHSVHNIAEIDMTSAMNGT